MLTRKERREAEKEVNYFFEWKKIQKHFFKDFTTQLKEVKDPRHQSYISYPSEVILLTLMLKQATGLKSMRQLDESFNTEAAIGNVKSYLGISELEELPHYDTINDYLEKLEPMELEKIRLSMIKQLLGKRSLEEFRLVESPKKNEKYWLVALDGSGLHRFRQKHCEHCLKQVHTNKETGETKVYYYHHVLEAKLVVGEMVFSIGSEFIENEDENVEKQDCELKAFYRLAARLKKEFPRLPICLLGDSLYSCDKVFQLCEDNGWKYLLRFKDERIPSIAKEYETLKKLTPTQTKEVQTDERQERLKWINGISYNKNQVNICQSEVKDKLTEKETIYQYVTNVKLTSKIIELIIAIGRSRWRIENEGFNTQKNHRLYIEHINSYDYTAMKNHYLMAQITEMIMVLYEKGIKIFRVIKKTIKEKSSDLLEAFRRRTLTDEDLRRLETPIQMRFT